MICATHQTSPPQRSSAKKESTNVSAGILKQQLALEDKLDDLLGQAERARKTRDFAAEVVACEKARDLVHSETLLAEQQNRVLWKLAGAYLDAKKPIDAITTYETVLELRRPQCDPQTGLVSDCAEVEQMIGLAKMQSGDFAGSLDDLDHAIDNYGIAASHAQFEMVKIVAAKDQAQTRLLRAVALFRTGRRDQAISENEEALNQLKQIESDANIQAPIRDDARKALDSGSQQLEKLKSQP